MKVPGLVALTCLILFAGTTASAGKAEHFEFNLGPEWKEVSSQEVRGQYFIMEFVRKGDDIESWKELVTVQNFGKSRRMSSPEKTMAVFKAAREEGCPAPTEWKVIEKKEDYIVYEWHQGTCPDRPEESEISKIVFGKHNVFVLHYAARVHELSPETRAEWIKRFAEYGIADGR